jgi:hypothetical protein
VPIRFGRLYFRLNSDVSILNMEVLEGLSASVFNALEAILPNEGRLPVRSVHVTEGWGYIHYVTVYSGLERQAAAVDLLEEAIHTIVRNVLQPRRNVVRIVWAT